MDQNQRSCEIAERIHSGRSIEVRNENVKSALTKDGLVSFDLICSAGLFDYLPDLLAIQLLSRLLKLLKLGGEVFIANCGIDAAHPRKVATMTFVTTHGGMGEVPFLCGVEDLTVQISAQMENKGSELVHR